MKNKNNLIKYFALIFIFFILGFLIKTTDIIAILDNTIINFVHNNINNRLFSFMKVVSFIGSGSFLVPFMTMVILYFLKKKDYYITKLLLINTLGSYVLNVILKLIFQRSRPLEYMLVEQGGLSFPSGHSMVAMSFYLTLSYLLTKKYKNKKKLIYSISVFVIIIMGISRVYLGVHWPSDIVGGFLMGYILHGISIVYIKENNL